MQLTWSYQADRDWVALGQSSTAADQLADTAFAFRDETMAFTRDGEVSFQIPLELAPHAASHAPRPLAACRDELGQVVPQTTADRGDRDRS